MYVGYQVSLLSCITNNHRTAVVKGIGVILAHRSGETLVLVEDG